MIARETEGGNEMRDDEETAAAHNHISQSQKVVPLQWCEYNFEINNYSSSTTLQKNFQLGNRNFYKVITHFRPIHLAEFLSFVPG